MFRYCLLRILHYIVAHRLHYPTTPILVQKVDEKSIYEWIHLHHNKLVQCCSTYQGLVLIPLWATFGGAPCPSERDIISETTTDLANHILKNKNRDSSKLQYRYGTGTIHRIVRKNSNDQYRSICTVPVHFSLNVFSKNRYNGTRYCTGTVPKHSQ